MYQKYYAVWKEHADRYGPRTALLYQVGGFFEIYDTENLTTGTTMANIREIAELCQLSLTVHAVEDGGSQTLFGGFPEHALGKFERILVQAGFTVVVVVQRKGRTGAVEERVVDHIASPGCYVESTKERRLVGIVLESLGDGPAALRRVYWAATALDIATGRIWFVEGVDRDRLHQFLCIHPPAELVLWSDGGNGAAYLTESLKALCPATHLRCLAAASVPLEEAALDKRWPAARTRLPWIHTLPQARHCLAALMEFAADHVPSALTNIAIPEAWIPSTEVRLGNAALEQLGLLSLRGSEGEKQSLLGMMDQCRSIAGRRFLRQRLMRPITDIAELNARLDRVDTATHLPADAVAPTERALRSLYDMSRLWRRLELGTATLTDMSCLLRAYESAATLMDIWPGATAAMRSYVTWVASVWDTATTVSLSREGGSSAPVQGLPWIPGNYTAADAAFSAGMAIRDQATALCAEWSKLQATNKVEQLYLDDAEGGGFRITGTKRRVTAVHAWLRDAGDKTAITNTFKTSATVENAALQAICAAHRTWYQSWIPVWADTWTAALSALVVRGREAHAAIEAWCADIDVSWTVSRLAASWLWTRPVFIDAAEASVAVTRLRHPILERITTNPYVAHSVAFGPGATDEDPTNDGSSAQTQNGLLLYGMNASGKSSLMKALGLCVVLAQCGFPVPAATCRISPFRAIFTRILGNDNLWAGLSSFAVEMTEFREILQYADAHTLVLGDELCSGTESLSATALVAAGVETLASRGTKFVFATHLHELASLPDIAGLSSVRAVHLKVHYDAATDRLVYDRHLAPGSGSALYGLEVCRALDLPTGYLDRAMALRKSLEGWMAPHTSAYSAAAVVSACAVCGTGGAALEMHHIQPQAMASTLAAQGVQVHAPSNIVCLCTTCHDDHHAGRLVIQGWEDTSAGRRLRWSRPTGTSTGLGAEVIAWIREQRRLKIRQPTIQRMGKQIFGVELTKTDISGVHL